MFFGCLREFLSILTDVDIYFPTEKTIFLNLNLFADLPEGKPRITGVNGSYEVGERIKAICTSWQSNPPANLSWFINAEPVRFELI